MNAFSERLKEFGPLRLSLLACAAMLALFATPAGTPIQLQGWHTISSLVLPAAAPLVFFVMLFDILMTSMRLSDAEVSDRPRWRRVLVGEILFAALLLGRWVPFFAEALRPYQDL